MCKMTQPLFRLMLICVNNQSIEWPPKTSNREKLVTLITIPEATGGLSNPIRQGTLTRALRFCTKWIHTSAMKKAIINLQRKPITWWLKLWKCIHYHVKSVLWYSMTKGVFEFKPGLRLHKTMSKAYSDATLLEFLHLNLNHSCIDLGLKKKKSKKK